MAKYCDYRYSNVYCFTETCLTSDYPDRVLQLPGFAVYRNDRNSDITG